jgi:TRAP-type C4-dicarboxylate transport system substrate-binding protein
VVIDAFETLGAQPTTMSFGELYTAIQQGVLDGAESDHTDLLVERFFEVTRYVSLTRHLYLAAPLVFSRRKYQELPEAVQAALRKAGRASTVAQRNAMEESNRMARIELEKRGLVFNEVDAQAFRRVVDEGKVHQRHAARLGGAEILQDIESD